MGAMFNLPSKVRVNKWCWRSGMIRLIFNQGIYFTYLIGPVLSYFEISS